MRKQIKEASQLITRAQNILNKLSEDEKIPVNVKTKAEKMSSALQIDIDELEKMRTY